MLNTTSKNVKRDNPLVEPGVPLGNKEKYNKELKNQFSPPPIVQPTIRKRQPAVPVTLANAKDQPKPPIPVEPVDPFAEIHAISRKETADMVAAAKAKPTEKKKSKKMKLVKYVGKGKPNCDPNGPGIDPKLLIDYDYDEEGPVHVAVPDEMTPQLSATLALLESRAATLEPRLTPEQVALIPDTPPNR